MAEPPKAAVKEVQPAATQEAPLIKVADVVTSECQCPVPPPASVCQKEDDRSAEPPAAEIKPLGNIIIAGDSMVAGFAQKQIMKDLAQRLGVAGKVELLAKGGNGTSWLLTHLGQKASYKDAQVLKDIDAVIISTGGNDVPTTSTDEIWGRLSASYKLLHDLKIKVIAATIAPSKGDKFTEWDKAADARRIELNERIRKSDLVFHVIDLAAKVQDGGLADNDDPAKMAVPVRLYKNDAAHARPEILIQIFRRELEIGMKGSSSAK